MITQQDIKSLVHAAQLAGFTVDLNEITVMPWEMRLQNHVPERLPVNHSAVYIFKHGDRYLKVGQAGSESNARYQSQHYCPTSSSSNLAKSLLRHHDYAALIDDTDIKIWIRENVHRYNILIPNSIHPDYKHFVTFAEGFLC